MSGLGISVELVWTINIVQPPENVPPTMCLQQQLTSLHGGYSNFAAGLEYLLCGVGCIREFGEKPMENLLY